LETSLLAARDQPDVRLHDNIVITVNDCYLISEEIPVKRGADREFCVNGFAECDCPATPIQRQGQFADKLRIRCKGQQGEYMDARYIRRDIQCLSGKIVYFVSVRLVAIEFLFVSPYRKESDLMKFFDDILDFCLI
jgi:hypothetical protein